MNAYQEYLTALRELDEVRGAQAHAARSRQDQAADLESAMTELRARVDAQRGRFGRLAGDCGLPPPATRPVPAPPPVDVHSEAAAATANVDAADAEYESAHYLAHRPKLLPRWRGDERNGLIYGCWALAALLVQAAVLYTAAGVDGFTDVLGHLAAIVALPFAAFTAGWLTIGVVSRPVLGEGLTGPSGKLQRNPRLGMVICLSTWLVACWLGGAFLR